MATLFFDYYGVVDDDGLNYELLDYIQELKVNHKVGLISNESTDRIGKELEQNSMYKAFDTVMLAFDFELAKPEPKVFELACKMANVLPKDSIFIDDQQANVDGAVSAGLAGIKYVDVQSLREVLDELTLEVSR